MGGGGGGEEGNVFEDGHFKKSVQNRFLEFSCFSQPLTLLPTGGGGGGGEVYPTSPEYQLPH